MYPKYPFCLLIFRKLPDQGKSSRLRLNKRTDVGFSIMQKQHVQTKCRTYKYHTIRVQTVLHICITYYNIAGDSRAAAASNKYFPSLIYMLIFVFSSRLTVEIKCFQIQHLEQPRLMFKFSMIFQIGPRYLACVSQTKNIIGTHYKTCN